MNISESIQKENGKKKMKRSLLGKIDVQGIGISAKKQQIKTTAKKSFLFFCSSLLIAMGTLCPMAISVSADVPIITKVKTMAELILTLTAGAGTVVTEPTIVNPIISEFGAADFQMQNLIDSGAFNLYDKTTGEVLSINTETAIDHIGDKDWLDDNNAEFKMDYDNFSGKVSAKSTLAKSGANILHQAALETGNPMDWDWGQLIQTYLNYGMLTYELLFTDYNTGNTIVEDMQGVLENILEYFTPNIENNIPMDIDMSNFTSGYNYAIMKSTPSNGSVSYTTFSSNGGIMIGFNGTGFPSEAGVCFCNNTENNISYGSSGGINSNTGLNNTLSPNNFISVTTENYERKQTNCKYTATTRNEAERIARGIINGTMELDNKPYGYLINPTVGNLTKDDLPNLSPSIEQGKAIKPIDQNDYQEMMNQVNGNTENNNPEENPTIVYPFIQDYIVDDGVVEPDPDTPQNPIPNQPNIPNKDPITDQEMEENLTGTTSGLEEIFPFCIPFDIVKLIKGLRAERKAPVIDWTFESDLFGFSYTFHIDLAEFNDVAAILRTMELIVFIIGLAVATRKLIGAGG